MKIRLLAVALLGLGCGSLLHSTDPIAPGEFRQLQALIKPGVNEDKWATIPWGVNLWEARRQAARLGKPILLWEMDGHPLACT